MQFKIIDVFEEISNWCIIFSANVNMKVFIMCLETDKFIIIFVI